MSKYESYYDQYSKLADSNISVNNFSEAEFYKVIESFIHYEEYVRAYRLFVKEKEFLTHSASYYILYGAVSHGVNDFKLAYDSYKMALSFDVSSKQRLRIQRKIKILDVKLFRLNVVEKELLYDGNNLIVYSTFNKSDTLFVTFDGDNKYIESYDDLKAAPGYAEKYVLTEGFDLIRVVSHRYSWYDDLSKKCFDRACFDIISEYKNVVFYGGSGGGYAALFYSINYSAKVLAYSPRCSLDPVCELKFQSYKRNHKPLSDFNSENSAFIIYDSRYFPDQQFVNHRIKPCFSQAHFYPIPFMGHGAKFLGEINVVKSFVQDVLRKNSWDGYISANKLRKKSKIYHFNLASFLIKKKKYRFFFVVAIRGLSITSEYSSSYDEKIINLMRKMLEIPLASIELTRLLKAKI